MIAISSLRNQSAPFEQGAMEDFRQEVSRANKMDLMVNHMHLNCVEIILIEALKDWRA